MEQPVYSVDQFISLVNQTLEQAYPLVWVEGEVSQYKLSQDKWINFRLKDEEAESTVDCFATVWQLKTPLEDGMRVVVKARPRLYAKSGRFSLSVDEATPTGEGALRRSYELLKAKLETEGLFAPARKRSLPAYPESLGLITSVTSEAYKDFIKIARERWSGVHIKVAPVQVQGQGAAEQVVRAIEYFNQLTQPVELLVIVRGGGSLEDLMAFNSEQVARAIAASRTPTIVGVGHEGDVSLADLAADARAATPTHAAKLALPDKVAMREVIQTLANQAGQFLERQIRFAQHQLSERSNYLERQLEAPRRRVERATHSLGRLVERQKVAIIHERTNLNYRLNNLTRAQQQTGQAYAQALRALVRGLRAVDPRLQLKRGYSIVRRGQQIIKAASQVELGDELMLQLAQDRLLTEVKQIQNGPSH